MIDFHCHLDLYPAPFEVADETQRLGVGVVSVTTTPSAWAGTSRIAKDRSVIKTALGLHPQLARERKHEVRMFERYLTDTRFVGEVGLDGSPEYRSSWADQAAVFERILRACDEAGGKIISIHSRRAVSPVLEFLEKFEGIRTPILHWFSGTRAELTRAVERGCWFSVGPAMLAGTKGKNLLTGMPRDRILLETDGPFAQFQSAALYPWDVTVACRLLSKVWGTEYGHTESRVRRNENLLLALGGADADEAIR